MTFGDLNEWQARISDLVFGCAHPTVIAAPPGFGIERITAELSSPRQDVPATILDLDSLEATPPGIQQLLRKHVVFVGREVPDLSKIPNAQLVDHRTLRFTESEALAEAARMGVDQSTARSIYVFSHGWPAYFCACLHAAKSAGGIPASEAYDRLQSGTHLQDLITECTSGLSESDFRAVSQLTHFSKISPGILFALLGEDGLSRIRRAGFPIVETQPGWYEILDPVRSSIQVSASLDEQTARSLAPELIADAGMVAGARILLTAGQPAAAATALRSVPVHKLDEGSQTILLSLLRTVLDTEKDDGSLHLRLARVHHNHGDLDSMRNTLQRAAVIAEDQLRPDLEIEAKAELLLLDLPHTDGQLIRNRHSELIAQAKEHTSSLAQIRLREVEIMLELEEADLQSCYQYATQLESVANDWELVGEPARASLALRLLASSVLHYLGAYPRAVDVLQRACALTNGQPQALLKSLTVLQRNYAMQGQVERALETSQKVEDLLPGAGLPWVEAYFTWSAMIVAGYQLDIDEVVANQRRAESLLGGLLSHPTGTSFLAEAAIAAALAGDTDQAQIFMQRASQRREETSLDVDFASVIVAAFARDLNLRSMVDELRATHDVPPERDWRLDLAVALAEGNDPQSIASTAERYGLSTLFEATVRCFNAQPGNSKIRIQLLGNFAIHAPDGKRELPRGKATELVKFLGVRQKTVPTDVAIEHLWGDVPTDVGLRRLKNVVSRARGVLGQDAVERRGHSIGLSNDVESDLSEVRSLLRRLRAQPDDVAAAIQVVDMYRGPLLELDVYHDWVDSERRSLEAAVLGALELVISGTETSAAWALDALRRLNPEDDGPFMAVADMAERQNDLSALQLALGEVQRICDDLEVRLPTDYGRLAARISTSAHPDADGAFEGA